MSALNQVNIFEYRNSREYLLASLSAKKKKNIRFSIRSWARQLQLESPALLTRILQGKRALSFDLATRLAHSMGLSEKERRYFQVLSLFSNAHSEEEKEFYSDVLERLSPAQRFQSLELDCFRILKDWYHIAILESLCLKNFNQDPHWIASLLGKGLTPELVRTALERLARVGLIKKNRSGKWIRVPDGLLKIGDKVPNSSVREYHRQVIDLAKEALESQPMGEREFRATTLPIATTDYPKLVSLVREFYRNVSHLSSVSKADHVYQINLQAFRLDQHTGDPKNEQK